MRAFTLGIGEVTSCEVPRIAVIDEKKRPLAGGYETFDCGAVWSKLNVDDASVKLPAAS